MGLDGVELILEIEEVFDLKISDEEAGGLVTAGDLCALVAGRLRAKASEVCLSSAAFYQLRRALMAEFGVARAAVRPRTRTAALLPAAEFGTAWDRLGRCLGLSLPELERPRWIKHLIQWLAGLLALVAMVALGIAAGGLLSVAGLMCFGAFLALLVYILGTLALFQVTRNYARLIPASCLTVRGTTEVLLRGNYGKIAARARAFNEDEVWQIVRRMVAEKAAVPLDDVTREARLVKDLGLG